MIVPLFFFLFLNPTGKNPSLRKVPNRFPLDSFLPPFFFEKSRNELSLTNQSFPLIGYDLSFLKKALLFLLFPLSPEARQSSDRDRLGK